MGQEDIDLDRVQRELDEVKRREQELEGILRKHRTQLKHDLAKEIKGMIAEKGYRAEEICRLILGARKYRIMEARGSRSQTTQRRYRKFADPNHPEHVYIRGPIPAWMKEQMKQHGYDPKKKEDREAFRKKYLKRLTD